jgi:hypothetical protein
VNSLEFISFFSNFFKIGAILCTVGAFVFGWKESQLKKLADNIRYAALQKHFEPRSLTLEEQRDLLRIFKDNAAQVKFTFVPWGGDLECVDLANQLRGIARLADIEVNKCVMMGDSPPIGLIIESARPHLALARQISMIVEADGVEESPNMNGAEINFRVGLKPTSSLKGSFSSDNPP